MSDFYIIFETLDALARYEESRQIEFLNREQVGSKLVEGLTFPPPAFDSDGLFTPIQHDALPLGTPVPPAKWRFDDPSILPDIWGQGTMFLVSERFRDVAQTPFGGSELLPVEVTGKAAAAAEAKHYQMLRLAPLQRDALDMGRTTTEIFQRFRRIKLHHFNPDFVPDGPMFMTPQSVYTFVTADLADRIQCAGITDVEFRDPTRHDPEIGYPPKPMPEDCP